MIEFGERDPGRTRMFGLIMFSIMMAGFAWFVFGNGLSGPAFAGYGALIAIPFCAGALFVNSTGQYSPLGCLAAPVILMAICLVLVSIGMEGFICVAMVLPVWIVLGLGGGLTAVLSHHWMAPQDEGGARLRAVGLAALPFILIYAEAAAPPQWQSRDVARSIVVDADSATIWPRLVSIGDISEAEGEWNVTQELLGVPRPRSATLIERDGHPVRLARWGEAISFEERVAAIDPGRSIGWRFAFPDDSLQNHTDRHISPDGEMLKIATGGYELEPLADGRTRVTLTTTYHMRSRMGWYLEWWGELLLGDVQDNVLTIVKDRSEAA